MTKTAKKPTRKIPSCREHSCAKPRTASGFCGTHTSPANRHHDRKPRK